MDQWFKENLHNFMIGLVIVSVGGTLLLFVLYFVLKRNVKKKKTQDQD